VAEELGLSGDGRGCDAVLICADSISSDPVELAGALARDRARVVAVGAVGLTIPRKIYYEKELSFVNSRSYGPGRYDPGYEEGGRDYPIGYVRWTEGRNLQAIVDLLAAGRMDVRPLITHRFPIERAPEAYELITGKRGEPFLGVLLTYTADVSQPGDAAASMAVPAGSLLASTTAAPLTASPRPAGPVRVGVLGAGNFASAVLLPALKANPQVRLVGIISASGSSAQHAAGKFGFQYASSDPAKVVQDPQVEAVAILTRHNLHAPQTLAALAAGKHVFCEKPLALTRAELEQIQAALPSGTGEGQPGYTLLMVGFNRRFAPLAVRMGQFFAGRSEPLYAHYRVNAGYIPLNHWTHDLAQGGGRIIGEGCHFIDFLTFLVGAAPVKVSAQGLPDAGRYREDNVALTFTFPDGSLGVVSYLANGDKAFPKERVEAFCAGRVAVLDDFRSLELVSNGRRQGVRAYLRQDKGHQAEWQAFAAAIQAGGPPPIPYAQVFGVSHAAIAAVEALRTQKVIQI